MLPLRSHLNLAAALVLFCAPLSAQTTIRVSVDSNGALGNDYSGAYGDAVSAYGCYVTFGSGPTNLLPGGVAISW